MSKRSRPASVGPLCGPAPVSEGDRDASHKRIRLITEFGGTPKPDCGGIYSAITELEPRIVEDDDDLCEMFTTTVALCRPSVYGVPGSTVHSDDGHSHDFRYIFQRFEIVVSLSNCLQRRPDDRGIVLHEDRIEAENCSGFAKVNIRLKGHGWSITGSSAPCMLLLRISSEDEILHHGEVSSDENALQAFFALIRRPSWTRRYEVPKIRDKKKIFYAVLSHHDIFYLVHQLVPLTTRQFLTLVEDGPSQPLSNYLVRTWLKSMG